MGKWEGLSEFFNDCESYHPRLSCIELKLDEVLQNQRFLMSQLDDLTTAANAVGSIIDQIKTDEDSVLAKLSSLQSAGATNLAPVIAQLQGIHDKAVLADNALAAAGAPAPAPVPMPPAGGPGTVVTPPGVTPPPPTSTPVVAAVPPHPIP